MDIEGVDEQKLIEQQMEETRASLSNKLEALETQVAESVQTATEAVQTTKEAVAETVETVKVSVDEIRDRVGGTVRSVANFFDIKRQAEERPWLVLGGSIGLGCLAGWYLTPGKHAKKAAAPAAAPPQAYTAPPQTYAAPPQAFAAVPTLQAAVQHVPTVAPEPEKPSWIGKEMGRLRGLGIGLAMGSLRDLVKQTLPGAFSDRIAEEVDKLTPQFGGEVIRGQILPDLKGLSDFLAPEPSHESAKGAASDTAHDAAAKKEKAYA